MKTRMLCLILALLLLPFGASASEEPQAVRTDYTYFYMTVSITDETTGEYYGTTLEGGTIPGDQKSPEAMEIRQALIRQADAYAAGLLRPGTELADRDVIKEEEGFGTCGENVIRAHGNQVDADGVSGGFATHIIVSG